jgi:mannose-6-phosphate isomerase-like protein (cupin superfamily)
VTAETIDNLAARHAAAESQNRNFSYAKPQERKSGRAFVALAKTDCMSARVVVLKKGGGENILHYHDNGDSCWYVLKGRVRFYGPDDVLIGEFGANEGTCTPRFRRYWFENVGEDELEMLHFWSIVKPSDVTSIPLPKPGQELPEKVQHFDARLEKV